MTTFSPRTLGSQLGGRQRTGILGIKSPVRQRSARSSPLRRRSTIDPRIYLKRFEQSKGRQWSTPVTATWWLRWCLCFYKCCQHRYRFLYNFYSTGTCTKCCFVAGWIRQTRPSGLPHVPYKPTTVCITAAFATYNGSVMTYTVSGGALNSTQSNTSMATQARARGCTCPSHKKTQIIVKHGVLNKLLCRRVETIKPPIERQAVSSLIL